MLSLLVNYFSINSLTTRFRNKGLSIFCFFDRSTWISRKTVIGRFVIMRNSTINDYSYIGYNSNLNNVQIGKYCSISKNVNIGLSTHPITWISTSHRSEERRVGKESVSTCRSRGSQD